MHRERWFDRTPGRQLSPGSPGSSGSHGGESALAPGKRTLTDRLAPHPETAAGPGGAAPGAASAPRDVSPAAAGARPATLQMLFGAPRAHAGPGRDPAQVHAAAARGAATPAAPLPHAEPIQRAFGRHDISAIRAHIGGAAADSAREIGARAYAVGDHVVLGPAPDLHTVAHEAAHVIQQRAGVQLKAGVGELGDAYERHADEVADLVVAGRSAEAALDRFAPGAGAAGAAAHAVQRAPVDTHYGTFEDESFHVIPESESSAAGVEMFLRFTPNAQVDASEILLSQSVKTQVGGALLPTDATKRRQQVASGSGAGYFVDGTSERRNPLYLEPSQDTDEGLHARTGAPSGGFAQHGYRTFADGQWTVQPAQIHDQPTLHTNQPDASTLFETTAIAVKGNQQNTYYGSVTWGMRTDADGNVTKVELARGSDAVPTQKFMAAARQWNASTARGTLVTSTEPTAVHDEELHVQFTLPRGVKLAQRDTTTVEQAVYLAIEVDGGAAAHGGKTGYVKLDDVEDRGDGLATIPLPHVQVKRTLAQVELHDTSARQGPSIQLPQGTRLRLLQDGAEAQQIEVIDGPHTRTTGWLAAGQIADET